MLSLYRLLSASLFFISLSYFGVGDAAPVIGMAADLDAQKPIPILMAEQKGERDQILPLSQPVTDFFNYFSHASNLKFDIRRYPWRRVLRNGENGEGLIFGIYRTPEREKIYAFSEAVYTDKIWLVTRCEDHRVFNQIGDLRGWAIGIVQGSSAGSEFDEQVNVLFRAEYNNSSLAGRFSKLYQKRMDAFLLYESRTNLKELQKELNHLHAADIDSYKKNRQDIFCILPKAVSSISVHFASKIDENRELMERIDRSILRARKSGELDRIFSR